MLCSLVLNPSRRSLLHAEMHWMPSFNLLKLFCKNQTNSDKLRWLNTDISWDDSTAKTESQQQWQTNKIITQSYHAFFNYSLRAMYILCTPTVATRDSNKEALELGRYSGLWFKALLREWEQQRLTAWVSSLSTEGHEAFLSTRITAVCNCSLFWLYPSTLGLTKTPLLCLKF